MRFLLLSCLAVSPLVMQEGRACFCFSVPLCNSLPNPYGKRTIFVGTVVDVFPASVNAYKSAFNENERGSLARHKALIHRLWGPVLSADEARSVKRASSHEELRVASELGMYARRVRFRVSEWLEGGDGIEFELFTEGSDCGYAFSKGKKYLVVSRQNIETNRWWTGACSRTSPVESVDAQEDLIALRDWRAGRPLAPRVYGKVFERPRRQPGDPRVIAAIRLVGDSVDLETRTDAQGRFAFDYLTPGKYRIEITAPAARGNPRELDLSRGGCFEASVFIEHDATGTQYGVGGGGGMLRTHAASPSQVFLEPAPSVVSPMSAPLFLFPARQPPVPVPNPIR